MAKPAVPIPHSTPAVSFDQLSDWVAAKDLRAYLRISKGLAYTLIRKNHPRKFGRHLRVPKELFKPVRGRR